MQLRVVGQHHVWIEDAGRVQKALELPHQLIGVMPPFQLDEGRHVASGAVLGLERAAVLHGNQLRDVIHEGRIARHLF
ncbi:hypothetical protein D3C79_718690 [compost metagenome]